MTDEQIIKAMECCSKDDIDCEDCPAHKYCDDNTFGMVQNVFNLLIGQKAEIAKKDAEIDILIRKKESLRDEICKLQNEVGHWKRTAEYNAQKYAELVKEMEGD